MADPIWGGAKTPPVETEITQLKARITELEAQLAEQAPAVDFVDKVLDSVGAICDLHGRTEGDTRDASQDRCVNAYIEVWGEQRERIAELEAENERLRSGAEFVGAEHTKDITDTVHIADGCFYWFTLPGQPRKLCYSNGMTMLRCPSAALHVYTGPTTAAIPEGENDE